MLQVGKHLEPVNEMRQKLNFEAEKKKARRQPKKKKKKKTLLFDENRNISFENADA